MDCDDGGFVPQAGINGLVPLGWTALVLAGRPDINSASIRLRHTGCGNPTVERLEGDDALVMAAQDLETPPVPGKPFDALVYQRFTVTPGKSYSLSAWMVSFCGGTSTPSDCPTTYYIAKMLGVDPSGGTDPNAPGVIWTENRQNFTQTRWVNLDLSATAPGSTMTIFARIRSPYQHHGDFAEIDAVSVMEAPAAWFVNLPSQVNGVSTTVTWDGKLSPDIAAIPAGTYTNNLHFDVQSRSGTDGAWQDWISDSVSRSAVFTTVVPSGTYYFRVRALAEQLQGVKGAWPNHRYVGPWVQSGAITIVNHPPVAADDSITTLEDTPVQIAVLANDSDPDPGTTLSISSVGPAQHGTVTHDANLVYYASDPDFNGSDVFTYTVTDGSLVSAPGTVSVTITPVDDPPRISSIGTRMNLIGETVWLPLRIYDPEAEPITVTVTGLPPGLSWDTANDAFVGTLAQNSLGTYGVTVTATDPEKSTSMSFDWWVLDQVWRTRMPLVRR
jgi:hypothetical protein